MVYNSGMVFHSLFRAHHNAVQARLNRQGLGDIGSPHLLLVLRDYQSHGGPPSQRELADRLHVSAPTIATSLKSLERNGYVERRTDPADSRRNLISITPKALDALENSRMIFDAVDETAFSGFSDEEIAQINHFHLRMLQNLYQIGGDEEVFCPPPPPPERTDKPL